MVTIEGSPKKSYHHGDLQRCLLTTARTMIKEHGIDGLSLRKLANSAKVSRTALYHHFRDKQDLLGALAEQGFEQCRDQIMRVALNETLAPKERFYEHIIAYVKFAVENPDYYDLMFGRAIWKSTTIRPTLKAKAYQVFQEYMQVITQWQTLGLLPRDDEPLKFTQVCWSTLHGISRLFIDGIYTNSQSMESLCNTAANLLLVNEQLEKKKKEKPAH